MRLATTIALPRRRVVAAVLALALCTAVPVVTQPAAADTAPLVHLSATSIAFPDEVVGATSTTRLVTVSNNGDTPLRFSGHAVQGDDFSATSDTCPAVLAAGASCQLGVAFAPATSGPKTGTLSIGDNAADSPQTVALTGRGVSTVTLSAPGITFPDQHVGTTSVPGYVTLTNNSEAPLTVSSLGMTGDSGFNGTFGTCTGAPLAAHSSCELGATFTPAALGSRSATLLILDSAPDSPQQITLTGVGVESVTLSPRAIAFGDQHVRTTSLPGSVTFTNIGETPLDLRALETTTDDFTPGLGTCPLRIEPHTSCQLTVTFTPADLGARSGTFLIYFDSSPESPAEIALTGTGTGAPATANLDTDRIDFGDVEVGGGTLPQEVTLTNKGDTSLQIDRLRISGGDSEDFSPVIACGAPPVVPPGGSCRFGVIFTPSARGVRTATLLLSDSAGDSPQQITVTGRGAAAPAAPTIDTVTAGDGAASVAFTPPADDGGAPITGYTVTASPGLTAVTGTKSPITVTGLEDGTSYTFRVTAVNSVAIGPSSAASTAVTPAAPLAVTSASPLPGGTVGHPYATTLTATGGIAPLAWTVAAGSALPAGLTLHADGTITGTPTTARAASFSVHVTDAARPVHTASKTLSLTVEPAPVRADLAVSVAHVGRFVSGWFGWYRFAVTDTSAVATAGAITVSATLPAGLVAIWGAAAAGWTCAGNGRTGSCTHAGPLAAHQTSSIVLLVLVTAPAGQWLSTTATVTPTDARPANNTATDRVQVQRR